MKYSLILLPFLASAAAAQDDIWKSLAKGDRVQITFRSGNTILGNLASRPADPRNLPETVDYSTASEVTLDVSLEYPGLNGTMTILKKEIKEIRKLQNLDPATMKRIQEEMKRIQQQAASDEAKRKAEEEERDKITKAKRAELIKSEADADKDKDKGALLLKEFQDLQKGKELLKRFPPDKYGPQTLKEVVDMGVRKQPVPPDIREYADPENLRLWNLALKAQQEAQPVDKKEKVEEKKQ
jgi:hypothetical protein